jgi:prepilin signal peptidase PulO-like enzyme (type II secretory pathway)
MAAGFVGAWALHGLSLDGAAAGWLFFACVVLWGIDSRHFLLPDAVTLTGLAAGAAFALARGIPRLGSAGEASGAALLLGEALDRPPLLLGSLAGALAGAAVPLAARAGYRLMQALRGRGGAGEGAGAGRIAPGGIDVPGPDEGEGAAARGGPQRRGGSSEEGREERPGASDEIASAALEEGMGLGDVKMLAMVGAFLGPRAVLITILAGSISGCLVVIPWLVATRRGFRTPIPFGPFLSFGAILTLFAGDLLAEGYERLLFRILG